MNCIYIIHWPSSSVYHFENDWSALKFRDFLGLEDTTILTDETSPLLIKCRESWSL